MVTQIVVTSSRITSSHSLTNQTYLQHTSTAARAFGEPILTTISLEICALILVSQERSAAEPFSYSTIWPKQPQCWHLTHYPWQHYVYPNDAMMQDFHDALPMRATSHVSHRIPAKMSAVVSALKVVILSHCSLMLGSWRICCLVQLASDSNYQHTSMSAVCDT